MPIYLIFALFAAVSSVVAASDLNMLPPNDAIVRDSAHLNVLVYVLCYDETSCNSAKKLFKEFTWALILELPQNKYFETYAFANIFPTRLKSDNWEQYDYIGTISWKAPLKFMTAFGFGPFNMTDVVLSAPIDADVIGLVGHFSKTNLVTAATRQHPRFKDVWMGLLRGFDEFTERQISTDGMIEFFCNYWLAKPKYVTQLIEYFQKAHRLMETLPTIQKDLWSDANYWRNNELTMNIFNKPYYAYHPFVLERLTPFFFNVSKANIHVYKYFGMYKAWKEKSDSAVKQQMAQTRAIVQYERLFKKSTHNSSGVVRIINRSSERLKSVKKNKKKQFSKI